MGKILRAICLIHKFALHIDKVVAQPPWMSLEMENSLASFHRWHNRQFFPVWNLNLPTSNFYSGQEWVLGSHTSFPQSSLWGQITYGDLVYWSPTGFRGMSLSTLVNITAGKADFTWFMLVALCKFIFLYW